MTLNQVFERIDHEREVLQNLERDVDACNDRGVALGYTMYDVDLDNRTATFYNDDGEDLVLNF